MDETSSSHNESTSSHTETSEEEFSESDASYTPASFNIVKNRKRKVPDRLMAKKPEKRGISKKLKRRTRQANPDRPIIVAKSLIDKYDALPAPKGANGRYILTFKDRPDLGIVELCPDGSVWHDAKKYNPASMLMSQLTPHYNSTIPFCSQMMLDGKTLDEWANLSPLWQAEQKRKKKVQEHKRKKEEQEEKERKKEREARRKEKRAAKKRSRKTLEPVKVLPPKKRRTNSDKGPESLNSENVEPPKEVPTRVGTRYSPCSHFSKTQYCLSRRQLSRCIFGTVQCKTRPNRSHNWTRVLQSDSLFKFASTSADHAHTC